MAGQTQDILVNMGRSSNTSKKVLTNTEVEDVTGWKVVRPRREGVWRPFKPPG
jgi:hypothetical protein